jgi:putative transposase
MRLVYSFRIDPSDKVFPDLERMSRVSKDLYNQALFEVKSHYEKTKEILSYSELDRLMKTKTNIEGEINYCLLPAKVAQQTLMLVSQNVRAFFAAFASYKEHPEKYRSSPQFPHFLPFSGHFVLVFTNQQARIKEDGTIKLTKGVSLKIPTCEFVKYKESFIFEDGKKIVARFQQIRVVPKFNGDFFNVEIIYSKEEFNSDVDINRVASIDLGVNNLVALVDSAMGEEGRIPLIINGRPIKSINQFYNKRHAEIQEELASTNRDSSMNLRKITDWRNEKVLDYMHKTSRFVINYCLKNRIGHIVIGKNKNWKQEVKMGKRNNQNFVAIPFDKLLKQIQYKAQLVGIKVTLIEESYTSKCSALDLEEIAKHEDHAYAGRRIHRGLFLTAKGILLNADVNGALNLLRKVIGDAFLKPILEKVAQIILSSGVLWHPVKVCL